MFWDAIFAMDWMRQSEVRIRACGRMPAHSISSLLAAAASAESLHNICTYTVLLNGQQTTQFTNTNPQQGLLGEPNAPSHIGLQGHFGSRVAFQNICFKALP
jgi:hypothetical protein